MRAAIYNRFWNSMGGGERYSAMIAQVLSRAGVEVDLLGHIEVSLESLGSRLAVDLSRTTLRVTPDLGESEVSRMSADYDLFIDATYMSRVKSRATRSAYLCFFPTPFDHEHSALGRAAIRVLGPHVQHSERLHHFRYGTGWFPQEGGHRRQWAWSNGDGVMVFDPGPEHVITADFGRPGSREKVEVVAETAAGEALRHFPVDATFRSETIAVPASDTVRSVHLRSPAFWPGPDDNRHLGIAMSRLRHRGERVLPAEWIGIHYPWLRRDPDNFDFLSTYDVIVAISVYTQDWIARLWNTKSEILFPPIEIDKVIPSPQRECTILSVGRFFAPGYGHSKRQLEMVQIFGRLVRSGQLDGWKLVLIGGCEDTQLPYLRRVRAEAGGLPVDIHANAPRALLDSHLSSASIFWSATGLGENTEKRPWTNEHFGMTTAEAMSGGCVPVVIDRAGQREIVRQGVDGFRWSDERELRIRTLQVATDETLRARLAASAMQQAAQFSDQSFALRWNEIARSYHLLDPRPVS